MIHCYRVQKITGKSCAFHKVDLLDKEALRQVFRQAGHDKWKANLWGLFALPQQNNSCFCILCMQPHPSLPQKHSSSFYAFLSKRHSDRFRRQAEHYKRTQILNNRPILSQESYSHFLLSILLKNLPGFLSSQNITSVKGIHPKKAPKIRI